MIHSASTVDPKATLGRNVTIGPNCFVGPNVVLGDDCVLHNNVTITGHTVCGPRNEFYPGSVIGAPPQDLKYKGGLTRVEIGEDNVFREMVTVHAGTEVAGGPTWIGSHNRFLVGVHIAHDAKIGNDCILSNYVQLAGHVCLEDKVTMGGIIGVHHFTTIGMLAYIGGLTRIINDVPPFMIVEGNPARVRGFNETGMKRWAYTEDQIRGVREAYRTLFGPKAQTFGASTLDRLAAIEERQELNGEVRYLCESIRRSIKDGVYGRWLERNRRDTHADRQVFYGQTKSTEGAK
ncbi:MAG: acyl-ACP--UDP-N-acetylglucosamine O-acyltransferase [Planctomycetes bacterium]|nr:acyl-ACP--UDP-N-acetylglucosamine O-acyltransferase [Planctomycetota bacterium]